MESIVKEAARYAIVGSLVYAAYLAYKCPCKTPVKCEQKSFYAATLIPVALVALSNAGA
jgi:hypothetical protein